ncbi:hypothetical protein Tco_0152078 [Tanacetum coccineum]
MEDVTPGVMKLCAWLKGSFENFHEPNYDVLVKLEECCWKVNAHEVAFTRWENYGQGSYANAKTKRAYDAYLDINRIFGRFEMIKYSFDAKDEYVAIKEHECYDQSKTNIDTFQAYRELFRIMDEGWLITKACDE